MSVLKIYRPEVWGRDRIRSKLPPAVAIVQSLNQIHFFFEWGSDQDTPIKIALNTYVQPVFKSSACEDFDTIAGLLMNVKPDVYIGGASDGNAVWLTDYQAALKIAKNASHVALLSEDREPLAVGSLFVSLEVVFLAPR